MGSSSSKGSSATARPPNNPMELQQYHRDQYEREYRRIEKDERRAAKAAEKARQMAALRTPARPFVPKKPEPKLQAADYDAEAKRRMQDQLAWDSQTFVLNQLMLSVQFFENYEREMWQAVETNRHQENRQTQFVEQHCKVVLLPDRLQEAIDKRIVFCPRHGTQKSQPRPLHQQAMYIVHENIEVTNPGERSNYSILTDAPIYKVEIDNQPLGVQKTHVGYVRLKCVEGIHINRLQPNTNSTDLEEQQNQPSVPDESDEEEIDPSSLAAKIKTKYRDSIMRMSANAKRLQQRRLTNQAVSLAKTSQQSSGSSTEYDYAYITALSIRQPLTAAQSPAGGSPSTDPISSTMLPFVCFSHVPATRRESESDEDDEDNFPIDYEMRQYLSSNAFLTYFLGVFRDTLAVDMQIPKHHIDAATWKGATIYNPPWEIIPALSAPWPNEAYEWMHRQRDIKVNPITQQQFQWPTPDMVNKVVSFGCLLVPLGFIPKSGPNPHRDLEWKIVFPNAERYLEGCLTSAQCKVYIVTKALLQTFVEPFIEGTLNGFTNEHLRTHLFWQCEMNYAAWPEDYLGEALLRFLKSLLEHIKRQRLPDYFLPKRNLFENIPERIMVDLHKRIFRITENPLMYTLIALRNLRFRQPPGGEHPFDFKELYTIMTVDNPLKLINPNFCSPNERNGTGGEIVTTDEEDGPEALGAIGYFQKESRNDKGKRRKTRKVRFHEAEQINDELERAARRASVESIDVRHPVIKHMEQLRRVIVYELFINHYLAMARESTPFKAFNQALIYLKQATRLSTLLADDDRVEQASNYTNVIETLQEVVLNERIRDSQNRPELPQRESVARDDTVTNHRGVSRIRVQRPIPSDYDPYKNCVKSTTTTTTPTVHPALERIVANQKQIQCEIHAAPRKTNEEEEVFQVLPVPQTPVAPTRAIRFNRGSVDDCTSDDGDSVFSVPARQHMKQNGTQKRTISATNEDIITAF